jgi:hypothetical protein
VNTISSVLNVTVMYSTFTSLIIRLACKLACVAIPVNLFAQ